MKPCAHCTHSTCRNESSMACNYGVSPVVVLRSDTCKQFLRAAGPTMSDWITMTIPRPVNFVAQVTEREEYYDITLRYERIDGSVNKAQAAIFG
jgi:hypothetical protein